MPVDVLTSFSNYSRGETSSAAELATEILGLVMQYRRVPQNRECADQHCRGCAEPHREKVLKAVVAGEPVVFVLPAFPGKSPNPAKVLGTRPDMAERQSLAFLQTLCRRIEAIYPPGAEIVLCSDGRVFNDVVGITDEDITQYQQDLLEFISDLKADRLKTFNLDHVFGGVGYDKMRDQLMTEFGESLSAVQAEVRAGGDTHRLYCGLTRFLLEDALRPDMTVSKTALQKQSRLRAYEVIQRSRAWDQLLAGYFPDAVRLSIHPQLCGSRKIGIHLMETEDEWLTAWHSVAVEVKGRFRLMKRAQVERLGAQLIYHQGRPSHYVANALPEGRIWR